MNVRTFVSVPVPNSAGLGPLMKDLGLVHGVRRAAAAQLHITLRFIGDLPEERIDEVGECVDKAVNGRGAGQVRLRGMGAFPNERTPRVLGVAVDTSIPLAAIAAEISRRFVLQKIPYDPKPFNPHLTVARVEGRPNMVPLMHKYADTEFASFYCTSVLVMKSELSPCGAIHTVLRSCDL
ncbi:MAG: RNA 2',3'-cyclic phosphodiesterase [Candidatus Methanomethylophilus sp.]|nr:RNA 2',3'-cyclic phosphodiesterase [Methanomethylophilus sp.]